MDLQLVELMESVRKALDIVRWADSEASDDEQIPDLLRLDNNDGYSDEEEAIGAAVELEHGVRRRGTMMPRSRIDLEGEALAGQRGLLPEGVSDVRGDFRAPSG